MYTKKNARAQEDAQEDYYTFTDEETKRKVKQHLTDINDIITENDIKNAKVPGKKKSSAKKKPLKQNKESSTGTEGNPVTPWDIVD